MLNGFANENMSQNRFMARTRIMSNNFANAIGSPNNYKSVNKAPISQQFANAIGTPTKFNPVGYTPSKCVGGRCPSGLCCLKNGTNIATGVTADWCIPCSDFQKFDGGYKNANGNCGCGCKGNCNGDPILGL